jgi:hypothetical protein
VAAARISRPPVVFVLTALAKMIAPLLRSCSTST